MKRYASRPPSAVSHPQKAAPAAPVGVVLRNITVHHEPRTLRRPQPELTHSAAAMHTILSRDPKQTHSNTHLAVSGSAAPVSVTAVPVPLDAQALREEGYKTGFAAGKLAAEEAARLSTSRVGYQEGFDKGMQEGVTRGLESAQNKAREAQQAWAGRLKQIDQMITGLQKGLESRLNAAEEDMVALCHGVMCRILGEALVNRDVAIGLVRQTIQDFVHGGLVAIHVSPKDFELLHTDSSLATWIDQRQTSGQNPVRWVVDERVELGGCIVHSLDGSLDARIETQWGALRDWLVSPDGSGSQA